MNALDIVGGVAFLVAAVGLLIYLRRVLRPISGLGEDPAPIDPVEQRPDRLDPPD